MAYLRLAMLLALPWTGRGFGDLTVPRTEPDNAPRNGFWSLFYRSSESTAIVFVRVQKTGSTSLVHALQHSHAYREAKRPVVIEVPSATNIAPWRIDLTQLRPAWDDKPSPRSDFWIVGHEFGWDSASLAETQKVLPSATSFVFVTIARAPHAWLRSQFQHLHHLDVNATLTRWIATDGLHRMAEHYLLALPDALKQPFQVWAAACSSSVPESALTEPQLRTASPGQAMALHRFLDLRAVRQHLRLNVLVLLTEHMDLSLSLLSLALTGKANTLPHVHDNKSRAAAMAGGSDKYTISPSTLQGLAPALAPFEAYFGLCFELFVDEVNDAELHFGVDLGQVTGEPRTRRHVGKPRHGMEMGW